MDTFETQQVFVLSGVPTHTLVKPQEFNRILMTMKTPGRGLVIEGPSGIGKTTAVKTALDATGMTDAVTKLSGRRNADKARISALPDSGEKGLFLIDDFHRLPETTRRKIADYVKVLADESDEDTRIYLIGINKTGVALIDFSSDLAARVERIEFEIEPIEQIRTLIAQGEKALNIQFEAKEDIAREANGSFYLAQLLCYEICLSENILKTHAGDEPIVVKTSIELVKSKVVQRLNDKFEAKAVTFATGSKLRRDGRAPYLQCLKWLAEAETWSVDLDREMNQRPAFKASVNQVVEKGYLEELFKNNPELSEILHFADRGHILTAEDPQFIFYLRNLAWNTFSRRVGFTTNFFNSRYDVALSFSGSNREIAKVFADIFTEEEIGVFYDKYEQHRIAAVNVEDYLAPIYSSEASLVLCVMGADYPNRIWTTFESENFKDRFAKGEVIPVWIKPHGPSIGDDARKTGSYSLDPSSVSLREDVEAICADVLKKLRELRGF